MDLVQLHLATMYRAVTLEPKQYIPLEGFSSLVYDHILRKSL